MMVPTIYLDRSASTSFRCTQKVYPDPAAFADWHAGVHVICHSGRVLGGGQTYDLGAIEGGPVHGLTAAQLRALAEACLVAADVLDGKAEAREITLAREEREAAARRADEERAERDRRLAGEGVGVVCTGCKQVKRVLPEQVDGWLRSKPFCCRRRGRAHVPASAIPAGAPDAEDQGAEQTAQP